MTPRMHLKNMDWFKDRDSLEMEVNYSVEGSNPNNVFFKSPHTIMVNKFEKEEIEKMRKNPRFMSQSLIFKRPTEQQRYALSPDQKKILLKEYHFNSSQGKKNQMSARDQAALKY